MSTVKRYDLYDGRMLARFNGSYYFAEDYKALEKQRDEGLAREAELQKDMLSKCETTLRDVCEMEPAAAGEPDCLMINRDDLLLVLQRNFGGVE